MSDGTIVTKIGRASPVDGAMSRRSFLQIVGAASAVTATGCADSPKQNVYPHVKGVPDQVPGVAVWYRSTCTECSAGCGIEVRTREGRAVKIEGNPDHPVNRGGLCALGHSSIQATYDPDRVRQPLIKDTVGGKRTFRPAKWSEAYQKLAEGLTASGKKAFITGETSGALDDLLGEFSGTFGIDRVSYEALSDVDLAKASEIAFGVYGVPTYAFDKAEVVLNFGADFLETWVSPCGFAKDWAASRRREKPAKVIHIEPRLSLTGANADKWMQNSAGSESLVALGVMKILVERGKGEGLSDDVRRGLRGLTKEVDLDEVAKVSGIERKKLLLIADLLAEAKTSLVIAGGAGASAGKGPEVMVLANLMNLLLGNVGTTVNLSRLRKPRASYDALLGLVESINREDYGLLCVDGSNPVFSAPASSGLEFALKRVKVVVSFSSKLDETSQLADVILPSNTPLESWGDQRFITGIYSLIQPAMTPVFNTKQLGDQLIEISLALDKKNVGGGAKNFREYLESSWKKLQGSLGVGGDFTTFWRECVERGGYFVPQGSAAGVRVQVSPQAFSGKYEQATFETPGSSDSDLVVYPFVSVKSFDGRGANRPWLQELPDPITQIVWDAWAELHPETAKKRGMEQGDLATIRTTHGEVRVPVYVTEFVHPGVVAIPIGQGHASYGRYAEQVKTANVLHLLPSNRKGAGVSLVSTRATMEKGRGRHKLVNLDGSRTQFDRGIARTKFLNKDESYDAHAAHHGEVKQMYDQRQHPLYRWGMAVDLSACSGCSACIVACNSENNIPAVGKEICYQGREMSWIRIERYYDGTAEELTVNFIPMMCQQCGNAPCEPVCPVYATYHNEEGINVMAYNRCVGTRYCSNNCPYKVRRYNWFEYEWPSPMEMSLNPDVVVRAPGVMEKCNFCVQRVTEAKDRAKDLGRPVRDGEVKPACVQSCPTEALVFGDLNDPQSAVSKLAKSGRSYKVLDHYINTLPAISYLEDVKYKI